MSSPRDWISVCNVPTVETVGYLIPSRTAGLRQYCDRAPFPAACALPYNEMFAHCNILL
jgi:hypothetical protein